MRKAEIPATLIASPSDLLHDPHLEATGFWEERDTDQGHLRFPGIPTSFSETPGAIGDPGPALGADSRAVLRENGVTEAEIESLLDSKALIAGEGENRSEENTSEPQSLIRTSYAVFCMKKKTTEESNTENEA